MSPQVQHALKQLAISVALAVLGVLGLELTSVLKATGADTAIWGGIVAAAIAGAVRWVEGVRDAGRASEGVIQRSDVAFNFLRKEAVNPNNVTVQAVDADTLQLRA